jgi:hypothetical protein
MQFPTFLIKGGWYVRGREILKGKMPRTKKKKEKKKKKKNIIAVRSM